MNGTTSTIDPIRCADRGRGRAPLRRKRDPLRGWPRRPPAGSERGFTLVEVSILLTVVVVLSAVIAPVLSSTLADAREEAARMEMTAIAKALRSFLDDIGCFFVPQHDGGDDGWRRARAVRAPAQAPPRLPAAGGGRGRVASAAYAASPCAAGNVCSGDPVEILVSAGDIPSLGPSGAREWVEPPDGEWVDFLEYFLVSNTPGGDPSRALPTVADCPDPVGRHWGQMRAWRGAYLNVGAGDPWGNRYMVNTALLARDTGEDVVILSAGPDQEVDSAFFMDGFVAGDDDLALLFSSGKHRR